MADGDENPLIQALPPATDYLTYLTVLEYNLTKDQLPLLHDLLQDDELVTNIGWDLVQLLLPLLPESEQCLQDVACRGNPREVILKVTELLKEAGYKAVSFLPDGDEPDSEPDDGSDEPDPEFDDGTEKEASTSEEDLKLLIAQLQTLVHMLCVLHPRIKTKFPSRFLATSVDSMLPVLSFALYPEITRSALMFIREISGSKRPVLPPRGTEETLPTVKSTGAKTDPEADEEPDPSEKETTRQLLSTLITYVARLYIEAVQPPTDGSGLSWVERYSEKRVPSRLVPHRQSLCDLYDTDDAYRGRDALVSQILNIATGDLHLTYQSLLALIQPFSDSAPSFADFPPSAPIVPSQKGALYLLAAKAAISLRNSSSPPFSLSLIPDHAGLLAKFLSEDEDQIPNARVDAILVLGWHALSNNATCFNTGADAEVDEEFNTYLHSVTSIAATHFSQSLRSQANEFADAVLASHPSEKVRLAFLKDTLKHCPYESLKASAVAWVKSEMLKALENDAKGVFGNPETLKVLAPGLFPVVVEDLEPDELLDSLPFFSAALNFLYLLCESNDLREQLHVAKIIEEEDVHGRFVGRMGDVIGDFKDELSKAEDAGPQGLFSALMLLEASVSQAEQGLQKLYSP